MSTYTLVDNGHIFVENNNVFEISDVLPSFDVIYDLGSPANATYANNDAVPTLYDSSGHNNHATQATAANRPLFKTGQINGLPALQFDGSNDYMSIGATLFKTLFMVVKNITDGSFGNVISDNTSGYLDGGSSTSFFRSGAGFFSDATLKNRAWSGLAEVAPTSLNKSTSFRVLAFLNRYNSINLELIATRWSISHFANIQLAYLASSPQLWTDEQILQHINVLKTQFAL